MSVDCSISEGVATLLFNRPEKLNALTDVMWDQLAEHLERCHSDEGVRAVLLAGAGRAFSAGADVSGEGRSWERKPGPVGSLELMDAYDAVIRSLYRLGKPTIAAVQGPAIGIGWTLALCCDWLLVSEEARFRPAFLNLAKVPEGGFVYLVTRLVGELKARDLVYRSAFVSGAEAFELGLASRLVGKEELMDEARALAREAAAAPPLSFALTKQLFQTQAGSFESFLEQERGAIALAANTEDAVEGITAFREKRPARFTGR